MKCEKHRDSEAVGFCSECGRGVCKECKVELDGNTYCNDCVDEKGNYIECVVCGGQYNLKPGESISDFQSCECGGDLKLINKNYSKPNKKGNDIGTYLKSFKDRINFKPIIIGIITAIIVTILLLIPWFVFNNPIFRVDEFFILYIDDGAGGLLISSLISIAVPIMVGIVAGYIGSVKSNNYISTKSGIIYGACSSIIATTLILLLITAVYDIILTFGFVYPVAFGTDIMYEYDPFTPDPMSYVIFPITFLFVNVFLSLGGLILGGLFFGSIGGYLGVRIRKNRTKVT